jgi:dienelactone hydrolase
MIARSHQTDVVSRKRGDSRDQSQRGLDAIRVLLVTAAVMLTAPSDAHAQSATSHAPSLVSIQSPPESRYPTAAILKLGVAALATNVDVGSPPLLWGGLRSGAFTVGFTTLGRAGATTSIWYPSSTPGRQLSYRDLVGRGAAARDSGLAQLGISDSTRRRLGTTLMFATRDATPDAATFPLVLVAQGNGEDAVDQAVLSEYLASYGFVVVSSPSPLIAHPMQRVEDLADRAEEQAAQLRTSAAYAAEFVHVDTTRMAVVGHSFGARAALLFAMHAPRLTAVVSLDGGIGTASAQEEFRRATSFDSAVKLPPLLHFYEELDAFMKPDFALLRSLQFRVLDLRRTTDLHHAHFTSDGFIGVAFPEIGDKMGNTAGTAEQLRQVSTETLAFLRRALLPGA